jgi:hypothetical protein
MVGTGRFELPTPRTPSECSTRLSHVPTRKDSASSISLRLPNQQRGYTQDSTPPSHHQPSGSSFWLSMRSRTAHWASCEALSIRAARQDLHKAVPGASTLDLHRPGAARCCGLLQPTHSQVTDAGSAAEWLGLDMGFSVGPGQRESRLAAVNPASGKKLR